MVRFGIIGRNFIVDMMLEAMAAVPEVRPVAIYSRSLADAEAFREKHGLSFATDDLTALADYPGIDAVYIASPNCCHYEQAKLMLKHGRHVLCEKPAASNAGQVKELVGLAQEKGLVFLEAMRTEFADTLRLIRENLPRVGQLRQVRFDYCKISSRLAKFRAGACVNTFNPELSNAAIMDLGCYGIYSIVHLFGRPEAVSAQAVHLKNGFEASGSLLMQYPDFVAEVSYSKVHTLNVPSSVSGEDGTIYMDRVHETGRMWFESNDGIVEDLGFQRTKPNDMVCELKAFYRFVRSDIRPVRENKNSIITAEILDEARRQTGTVFPSDLIEHPKL